MPSERLAVQRKVDLRAKDAELLDALAKEAGKSFSAWAREVLLAAARA